MTKKHFIALADAVREHNRMLNFKTGSGLEHLREGNEFDRKQLETLADFCHSQNSQFNRERWLDYIAGRRGSNGGAIKPRTVSLAQQEHEESGCTNYLQHNAENCPLLK